MHRIVSSELTLRLDTYVVRNGDEFNWIVTRKLSHEADMEIRESVSSPLLPFSSYACDFH